MKGYAINLKKETVENDDFRRVMYTDVNSQLVLMSLRPSEEIGMERHMDNDQFIRCEEGEGECLIDGNEYLLSNGVAVIVPAGTEHNVINTSDTEDLKLYTLYCPPHHKDGIVRTTKADAEAHEEEFDGETTE